MWLQQAVTGSGKVEKKILRLLRTQFRRQFKVKSTRGIKWIGLVRSKVCTAARAQTYRSNNVQLLQAKSLMQQSVSLSFASQSFSIGVNGGGKL